MQRGSPKSGLPQDKQRARSEIDGEASRSRAAGGFIALLPARLEFDPQRLRAKPAHQPIEEAVRHVLQDRQADFHVPGKDTIARPAIDRADEVAGRLFRLDHLDRTLVRNGGAPSRPVTTWGNRRHRYTAP